MKKINLVITAMIFAVSPVSADNDKAVSVNRLPQEAQAFLNQNFKSGKIMMSTTEREWLSHEYKVTFQNGDKVEFDSKGNWESIECKSNHVPQSAVPNAITQYLNDIFPGTQVIEMERDRNGYEVKLNNGKEIKFDKQFRVYKIKR